MSTKQDLNPLRLAEAKHILGFRRHEVDYYFFETDADKEPFPFNKKIISRSNVHQQPSQLASFLQHRDIFFTENLCLLPKSGC